MRNAGYANFGRGDLLNWSFESTEAVSTLNIRFDHTGLEPGNANAINISTTGVVPEPLTILGAGTAIAFGGAFKRKLAKKK